MADATIAPGTIAFVGFGEAARAFLDGWRTVRGFGARVSAYDIKTDSPDPEARASKGADYVAAGVMGASGAPEGVAGAEVVFSVVTADQAHQAAVASLPGLARGVFFFDCDSCAPQTKQRTAKEVDAAGGRYVDVAVMAPVHPRLHRTPLLISGPHTKDAAPVLAARRGWLQRARPHAGEGDPDRGSTADERGRSFITYMGVIRNAGRRGAPSSRVADAKPKFSLPCRTTH